jgi:uncharacterized protein (DUF2252 family)
MKKTKRIPKPASADGKSDKEQAPLFRSREESFVAGKAVREAVPRERHARWHRPAGRRDPIDVLKASNRERVPELVPIRYGRMLRNPFTFLRGSAGLMASDLATTPTTGFRVQACGDCHLLNFGLFATPERNLIFDINDFDETLPAPWEWDVKRLAVSFTVAGRYAGHADKDAEAAAVECARAYREYLRDYSKQSPLEVWYDRIDEKALIAMAPNKKFAARREKIAAKARQRIGEYLYPKIANPTAGRLRLVDQPPILFHVEDKDATDKIRVAMESYRAALPHERRVLFDRYQVQDVAFKVVGIGSVGTRCYIGLFTSADQHPLLLQFKEAGASVLEPYAGKSVFQNHGQRVVVGQRLTQAASDIFLGWAQTRIGIHVFARQLRDMKMSVTIEGARAEEFLLYADICGRTLARAHAKSGDAALISGYLGKSDIFDQAIGKFAIAYANQNEMDHAALVAAVKKGRIEALVEEDL